jgi:hypothetical protein
MRRALQSPQRISELHDLSQALVNKCLMALLMRHAGHAGARATPIAASRGDREAVPVPYPYGALEKSVALALNLRSTNAAKPRRPVAAGACERCRRAMTPA